MFKISIYIYKLGTKLYIASTTSHLCNILQLHKYNCVLGWLQKPTLVKTVHRFVPDSIHFVQKFNKDHFTDACIHTLFPLALQVWSHVA